MRTSVAVCVAPGRTVEVTGECQDVQLHLDFIKAHRDEFPPCRGRAKGTLEVGTTGKGEVVINHPDLKPDADGVGHIVFSVVQARDLANTLLRQAHQASHQVGHHAIRGDR